MKQYLDLVRRICTEGQSVPDRTGTGTKKIFGHQMVFDLTTGFPLVTVKRTHFKSVVAELLWMLRGETNTDWLHQHGCTIWDEWADENGELGPVYGAQWRSWPGDEGCTIDQIEQVLHSLDYRPFSRRHVVSAWNPTDLPDETLSPQQNVEQGRQALPPCHALFQFDVSCDPMDGAPTLSCQLYQRSADVFLGVPFNIASYALLTHLMAHKLGYRVGKFIWTGGDCHLYSNHAIQVEEMLAREPLPLPVLKLNHPNHLPLELIEPFDIELIGYQSHPAIKAPVAI